jgi:hypothetical protein
VNDDQLAGYLAINLLLRRSRRSLKKLAKWANPSTMLAMPEMLSSIDRASQR